MAIAAENNANDLPLDQICSTIVSNVEGILSLGSVADRSVAEPVQAAS